MAVQLLPEVQDHRTGAPVLLVCSNGGHLAQLLRLEPWWRQHQRMWVTFQKTDAVSQLDGETIVWAYHPTTRNVVNLARNAILCARLLNRVRPSVIVSTGAAVAFPFFIAGRLLGIPTVFIEVYDRVDSTTLTGRLCRPLANLFLVQWPEQLQLYRGAQLIGPLL
jgi:beta-1,4-N-acetylglucosaminyltransferase